MVEKAHIKEKQEGKAFNEARQIYITYSTWKDQHNLLMQALEHPPVTAWPH